MRIEEIASDCRYKLVPVFAPPLSVHDKAIRALANLPPFSPILNRLMASLARQEVSFAEIAELIEKDTVLAGNLLKLVNSALYGMRGTITSVRHAVALLGVNKLRNATLSMSVARMWNQAKTPPGWSMGSFNLHCVGVAILSDLLAQRLPVDYAEGAFAAGLFHDIGWLLVVLGCPEEFKQTVSAAGTVGARSTWESDVLGVSHADLSAEAVASWGLPEPIRTAVRYHARPEADPGAGVNEITLSRIIQVADRSVQQLGCPLSLVERDGESLDEPPSSLADEVAQILPQFEAEFSTIRQYF